MIGLIEGKKKLLDKCIKLKLEGLTYYEIKNLIGIDTIAFYH